VLQAYADEIRDKIRAAAGARLKAAPRIAVLPSADSCTGRGNFSPRLLNEMVIGIGASTGGTEAIKDVLARCRRDAADRDGAAHAGDLHAVLRQAA
jgi:two-component system chemotaxis response regulator CheB